MTDDIDTGSISPPQSQPEGTVDVRGLSESELEVHVSTLLASVGETPSASGAGIASLAAVWVISQVEEACGGGRLVKPQDLTKDDFVSVPKMDRLVSKGGLAFLESGWAVAIAAASEWSGQQNPAVPHQRKDKS